MKRIITGALMLLLIGGTAQAQQSTKAKEHRMHKMEELNLTAEQKVQLQTLRTQQKAEWAEWKKNEDVSVKEAKSSKAALKEKHKTQLNALLTPAQQQQLAKARTDHNKGGSGNMHKRGGKDFTKELNLTTEQQSKMKDLTQTFKNKRQSLQQDKTLSDAQKKENLKALALQHRQEIKSLLTAEQQQKLEALRKEQRDKAGK